MHVLFATQHNYLPDGTGGMEINTDALCNALLASGAEVSVFCRVGHARLPVRAHRAVRRFFGGALMRDTLCGYPVYRAEDPILAASEAAVVIRPDAVVVQGWDAHRLAKAFVRSGVPTLIYMHNAQRFTYDDELRNCERLLFAANSRFTASLHADKHVSGVIPPLIEPGAFRVESTRQSVLFVNPIQKKGLAIAVGLARARPDVAFEFYEAWSPTAEERAEAKRLTVGLGNVRSSRAVTDMRQAYGSTKLVLFPSAMETWGRVASEGHISGIPTLGSDRGALPDTIGPAGLCVPFDAPIEDWLRAFSELWDDAPGYCRYSETARRIANRDEIRVETVVGDFTDLLQSVVAH